MVFLPLDKLKTGASQLGVELSESQLCAMDVFAAMLVDANSGINLTRITAPEEIVKNHYLDSLMCLTSVKFDDGGRIIDVGTGGGFPGIPIKIARPDLHVILLDATFKKVRFLRDAIDRLGLEKCEVVHARAEELGRDESYRDRFAVACVRALAKLSVAVELSLPFVKAGGCLIAQKGSGIDEEVTAAKPILGQIGGVVEKVVCRAIPDTDIQRNLAVIRKARATPPRFPRPYAQIVRKND